MGQEQEQLGVQEPKRGEEGTTQEGSGGKQRSVGNGAQVDGQGCLCKAGPGTGREVGRDRKSDSIMLATCSQMVQGKSSLYSFCNVSGRLGCPKIKLLQSFTVFIVAPLFLIVLICFALVCASGLFLLFQRFLLGPGLLPIFRLFFFLLGEGGFLLCSLENWESDAILDAAMT